MKCTHRHIISFVWRIGGGDIPRWFDAASFEAPDAQQCINCGTWLPLGPANDTGCEVEIAAARLFAGYVDANDTDDILSDPIAKPLLDWQLDVSDPMTPDMEQCDALYGAMSDDYHAEHDDLLSRVVRETEATHA
jgi:hypothetical protein